jgi:hypothetical protein
MFQVNWWYINLSLSLYKRSLQTFRQTEMKSREIWQILSRISTYPFQTSQTEI